MKPFFSSPERIEQLQFHAVKLLDTPFAPFAMVPGVGIDCIHVNAWVYLKTGFLKSFEPPRYSLDSGKHAGVSQLVGWLDSSDQFERQDAGIEAAGDAICFNMGMSEHHVALMLDGKKFIHVLAMHRGRVIISSLDEVYYKRRVTAVYRPIVKEGDNVR